MTTITQPTSKRQEAMEVAGSEERTRLHIEKKLTRKEILEKKKATDEILKAASAPEKDHLSSFPSFRHYRRNDLFVYLEPGRGDKLTASLKQSFQKLLKVNMEGPYGPEWPAEEKIKRREMVAPEARYIFVYRALDSDANKRFDFVNTEGTVTRSVDAWPPCVGFVQYRFTIEEKIPVLYVYELQLESFVQGKGLGRFLMELIELIAQKNRMGAVVLTVQKANFLAMSFYLTKLKYTVSSISPSRSDPLIAHEKNYEILCKAFDNEAISVLEKHAGTSY